MFTSTRCGRAWCGAPGVAVVELSRISRCETRQPWVAHDAMLAAWQGDQGGRDARRAYVRFVEASLADPPHRRFARRLAAGFWARSSSWLGCGARLGLSCPTHRLPRRDNSPVWTRNGSLQPWRISTAWTAPYCRVVMTLIWPARWQLGFAAVQPRRRSAQLAGWLGLSRADSVPNLTRRLEARLKASPGLSEDLAEILRRASAPAADKPPASFQRYEDLRESGRTKTKNKA